MDRLNLVKELKTRGESLRPVGRSFKSSKCTRQKGKSFAPALNKRLMLFIFTISSLDAKAFRRVKMGFFMF